MMVRNEYMVENEAVERGSFGKKEALKRESCGKKKLRKADGAGGE
jgi:hypothetical protein